MLDNEGVLSIISAKTPSWVAIGRENERWLVLTTWCFLFVKKVVFVRGIALSYARLLSRSL